jgi:peptidoglycan/xylan/chitin deacetylase (PgdA/CDA1 family)
MSETILIATLYIAAFCILIVIGLYWGVSIFIKIILKKSFLAKARRSDYAYLTFDDGPDPSGTPHILRLLEKYDARASFFVVGRKAESNPELIERIIDGGHAIGEHGYDHAHPWKTGPIRAIKDMLLSIKVFNSPLFPHGITLYRPPYGKYNLISLVYCFLKKKKSVFWNIDARDYETHDPETVSRHVMERIKPGSVILLHDGRQHMKLPAGLSAFGL